VARRLYAEEPIGVELTETVYALDSTTIDLCLALFPWAAFRATKAALKLHTLPDLRGSIPTLSGRPNDCYDYVARAGEAIMPDRINLQEKFALFHEHWRPKVIAA